MKSYTPKPTPDWPSFILVAGAGLTFGAFCSRVLAELPQVTWPAYRWWFTLALAALCSACFVGIWQLGSRARRAGQEAAPDASLTFSASIPFYTLILYLIQPEPNLLQAGVLCGGALTLSLLLSNTSLGEQTASPGEQSESVKQTEGTKPSALGAPTAAIVILLFIIPLIAYLATMMPGVGTRDGYELQAVSATLGFAHPTGYPLFPILGYLWLAIWPDALSVGPATIAWQINLLCAIFAAASVPLVYGTARRLVGRRSLAAWGALIYGFSHTLWTQASQPEKYTLNALFVAGVLYIALGTADPKERGPHPHLRWLALVYGLSLTHHRTMLMLAPALALYLLWRDPGLLRRPKEWLPALGIGLAPLLIYLYIPWRAYAQGWTMTASEFLTYISGSYYGPAVRLMDWASPERVGMFWRFVRTQYGLVGVGLAVVGLAGLGWARRWRVLACTAVAYATYYFWGTVWYAYYNDVNSFIPNHMIMAIWIATGVWTIWTGLHALSSPPLTTSAIRRRWSIVWTLAALMPMAMVWTYAPQVDKSDDWETVCWGEYALGARDTAGQEIAHGATILADREKHPPLDYFARVEGRRPDLDVVILGDEQAYLDRLAWDLAHATPVYLARFLPGMDSRYSLSSLGPLVDVCTAPQTDVGATGPHQAPLTAPARFGPPEGEPQIELLGYQAETDTTFQAGQSAYVTLIWKALWTETGPRPGNYQVNLRLVSAAGTEWWSSSAHPVSGMYPTGAWRPGEVIADWYAVPLAEDLPPGTYRLQVGLFYPFSREGLTVARQGDWATVLELAVEPPARSEVVPNRLRAIAPGQWQLIGYEMPRQAPPTGRVALRLYWQALAPLPDLEIGTRMLLNAPSDTPSPALEWNWSVPGQGEYPTSSWMPGQRVITTHTLTIPARGDEVTVQVAVREHRDSAQPDAPPIAFVPRWLAPERLALNLPAIQIVGQPPAAPDTINYGDRILLLSSDLSAYSGRELPPGAPVELTIHWQAAQAMKQDYTLFVQLLGPDGMLKGQIDVWPRDGTHPTSQWREGEPVEDHYLLYLDPDAPSGRYQVAVGWYLLETMQRLPVLDAEGQAIDDKILLPGPTVADQ